MKIPRDAISAAEWRAIDDNMVVHVRDREARYRVTGSGALTCLQGLVTCDLKAGAPGRFFGALLTNKGMIVAPLWIEKKDDQNFALETPLAAAPALEEVLGKSLPPRLCSWENVTEQTAGIGIYGPRAQQAPGTVPAVVRGVVGFDGVVDAPSVQRLFEQAGHPLMQACRILAGIPALGAEIDEKTLPQEVRFDELAAVSYTKGCYLGQETVARVHFRGHPNRRLVLALLDDEPPELPADLHGDGDKVLGRLTSATWSPELDSWVAQALVRREVGDEMQLGIAGGGQAAIRLDRWPRQP